MPFYCSKGHENPNGSRFCLKCNEKLELPVSKGIHPGLLLGDHYQIVRQLGNGDSGHIYQAEDTKQFSQPCVLKEFAPQLQTAHALQKAEELFEREASVLYKLQHPQIPRFRELVRVNLDEKDYLFLVQDYESGQTYRALLETRKREGRRFSEVEVRQLLLQILSALEYIHSMGVIHGNISPDNLILRSSDSLPVLIDFGGVKQLAANVASKFDQPVADSSPPSPVPLPERSFYAPYEQTQTKKVYPDSDFYALAATVLVLLTGLEPQELIDENTLTWNWRREVDLDPTLGAVLDKMLLPTPSKRYHSAYQVLQALTQEVGELVLRGGHGAPSGELGVPSGDKGQKGQKGGKEQKEKGNSFSPASVKPSKILLVLLLFVGAGGLGWWSGKVWLKSRQSTLPLSSATDSTAPKTPEPKNALPSVPQEESRRQALFNRGKELGIDENFLFGDRGLVNQVFYSHHPNLRQRPLTSKPVDADLRSQWYTTADGLLASLDKHLSLKARMQLGNYTTESGDRAKAEVNKLHISSRSLYDLANVEFFHLFPEQQGHDSLNQPSGQVWHGLVADKVKAMQAGSIIEQMVFDSRAMGKSFMGNLKPGEGKVYTAELAKAQFMRLNLQANSKVLLSVYSPSGKTKILEDSSDRSWSGNLPEKGFYEFVVVSTASLPVDYQLNITIKSRTKFFRRRGVPIRKRSFDTVVE